MKILYYLNLISFLIVISLYIHTPVYGVLAQIVLGIFQFALALGLTLESDNFDKKIKKKLNYYWLSILTWLVVFGIIIISTVTQIYYKISLFVIPMVIGSYLVIITFLIQRKHSNAMK